MAQRKETPYRSIFRETLTFLSFPTTRSANACQHFTLDNLLGREGKQNCIVPDAWAGVYRKSCCEVPINGTIAALLWSILQRRPAG